MTDPNRCWSGDLHAFTVDKQQLRCADCMLTHDDWLERGGQEARFDRSVLERWMGAMEDLT